jgi:DNA polymerase I-like protein with 3'-5' exonuclease and polymerase domains
MLPDSNNIPYGTSKVEYYSSLCQTYAMNDPERTLGLFIHFGGMNRIRNQSVHHIPSFYPAYEANLRCIKPTFRMMDKGFPLKENQLPNTLSKIEQVQKEILSELTRLVYETGFTLPEKKNETVRKAASTETKTKSRTSKKSTTQTEPTTEKKSSRLPDEQSFNPNSQPQLTKLLFDTLNLPVVKFTAADNPSTDKKVLEELSELFLQKSPTELNTHENAENILKNILTIRKLNATERYLRNYKKYAVETKSSTPDKKVIYKLFASLNPTGTKTTRYSGNNPNPQNISKNEPEGYEHLGVSFSLRNLFGPPEGYLWACIDYSQLQLRIFAYACKDEYLINAFKQGMDIHDAVARRVFKTDSPTSEQRRIAKGINFGIIFGAGKAKIEGMAKMVGVFDEFKAKFPLVDSFIKEQELKAKRLGYCETMTGYRLGVTKSKAYKACNFIVQGTEGNMVKEAIYLTDKYCIQPTVFFEPIMTIHDEIIFQSKIPMTISEATNRLLYKSQLNTICKLMNHAGSYAGIETEVDIKLTDSLWSIAA